MTLPDFIKRIIHWRGCCPHASHWDDGVWKPTGRYYDGGEFYRCDKCGRDVALVG